MTDPASRVPRAAAWLGGLGLIPFVAGAAAVWLLEEPRHGAAVFVLGAYAAIILTFMGAIHWGLAMVRPDAAGGMGKSMTLSVIPALVAWLALSLPPVGTLVLLSLGFAGVYLLDLSAMGAGAAPPWYRALRLPLTVIVLLCLSFAVLGLLTRSGP